MNSLMLDKLNALMYATGVLPTLIGIDYGDTTVAKTVLVLSETLQEAREFAKLMGFADREWEYVDHFRKVLGRREATLYLIAGGRERKDFSAIEGLFIQGDIKVIDMEQ